jgi:hydroxymethylpyrimidine/phosphomethylpyrimidine kinase
MSEGKGRVLIAAGSDSGGGAGIQADIKAVTALGGYAATAITALTAQNTKGVFGVEGVSPAFIQQQMRVVLEDIGADAVKTGMLHDAATIEAVAEVLRDYPGLPVVVDPVMVAQSGASLLQDSAVAALVERMLPLAGLLTPNLPEAEVLTGLSIESEAEMAEAGRQLLRKGAKAVLVKGGHRAGEEMVDLLVTGAGVTRFADSRIDTEETHGTGCTLASAIATGLAQGLPLEKAVARARRYLRAALAAAPGFGEGQGPVAHGVTVRPFD